MMRLDLRMCTATLVLVLAGCGSVPTTDSMATAAERSVLTVVGNGAPAVVFQSGLGDNRNVWRSVVNAIGANVKLVTYDRPGYGRARASATPRDPCTIAREQREMLQRQGLRPPYVLVGHSLGGLYQYVYAKIYPEDVAALVLVEPTHPEHWSRVQGEAPASAGLIKALRATAFSATMRAEFDAQTVCLDGIVRRAPLHLPVRLLVRDRFEVLERGRFEQASRALAEEWRTLTGATRVERVSGSSHYIQRDRPQVVARAIIESVREIQQLHTDAR